MHLIRTLALAVAACGLPAKAADLTVGCPGAPAGLYDYLSIGDALRALDAFDSDGPHSITVLGTCTENVIVHGREKVTIQAPEGHSAMIRPTIGDAVVIEGSRDVTLLRLAITRAARGVVVRWGSVALLSQCMIENHRLAGLLVRDGSDLTMESTIVRDNGKYGVNVLDSTFRIRGGVTIQNNTTVGLRLSGSRAEVSSSELTGNMIADNDQAGIAVNYSSSLTLLGKNTIRGHHEAGVQVAFSSAAAIFYTQDTSGNELLSMVEENERWGIAVLDSSSTLIVGAHQIHHNGGETTGDEAGVYVSEGSSAWLDAVQVSNNTGAGILAEPNATVHLTGGAVRSNSADGVRLERMSVAKFDPGVVVSGNGDADLACDSTSMAAGDVTGIGRITCRRLERRHGAMRRHRVE